MRLTRWDGGVPLAAWVVLATAFVQDGISLTSPWTAGGFVQLAGLVFAIGVVLGNRTCWIGAFSLAGTILTVLVVSLGWSAFVSPEHWDARAWLALAISAVQFGALVVLHPRWNAAWADGEPA